MLSSKIRKTEARFLNKSEIITWIVILKVVHEETHTFQAMKETQPASAKQNKRFLSGVLHRCCNDDVGGGWDGLVRG